MYDQQELLKLLYMSFLDWNLMHEPSLGVEMHIIRNMEVLPKIYNTPPLPLMAKLLNPCSGTREMQI